MKRDSQKTKIYNAEYVAFDRRQKYEVMSIRNAQLFADAVTYDSCWQALRCKYRKVSTTEARVMVMPLTRSNSKFRGDANLFVNMNLMLDWRNEHAFYDPALRFCGVIRLMRTEATAWLALHELAHIATISSEYANHGPEFAYAYLTLIRRHIGQGAHDRLARVFEAMGVQVDNGAATF